MIDCLESKPISQKNRGIFDFDFDFDLPGFILDEPFPKKLSTPTSSIAIRALLLLAEDTDGATLGFYESRDPRSLPTRVITVSPVDASDRIWFALV